MAVGSAEFGGETADPARIHQGGVGRGDLLGEDHGAAAQRRIGDKRLFQQIADQPGADDADIVNARREIGILHRREGLADLLDLEFDRALGIDPGPGDALLDAADQARIGQHREMGIEQKADLLGGRSGQRRGTRFQLAQLLDRDGDRFGKAGPFVVDRRFGDPTLADRQFAAVADIGGTDRDPRRDTDAR